MSILNAFQQQGLSEDVSMTARMIVFLLAGALIALLPVGQAFQPVVAGENKEGKKPAGAEEKKEPTPEEKRTVNVDGLVLKILEIQVRSGMEAFYSDKEFKKRKDDRKKMNPRQKKFIEEFEKEAKKEAEKTAKKGEPIDWIKQFSDYFRVKFSVSWEGDTNPVYVSSTVRFDSCFKASDGKTALTQCRIPPDDRPSAWVQPGAFNLTKGRKFEDFLIFTAPQKNAKQVTVYLFMENFLLGCRDTVKITIPLSNGKPDVLDKVTASVEKDKAQAGKQFKIKGKANLGKLELQFVDICFKRVNYLTKGLVFQSDDKRAIITIRIKNKDRKAIKYTPVLPMDALPGIAVDESGTNLPVMDLAEDVKLLDCPDLKDSIPGRGSILDYVVLGTSGGFDGMRLVLIPEVMFKNVKGAKGIVIIRVKLKENKPTEARLSVLKKSAKLKPAVLTSMLEPTGKNSGEAWDRKYCGLAVTGWGEIREVQYDKESSTSFVFIYSHTAGEDANTREYGYVLVMNNEAAPYKKGDKIQFKGVAVSHDKMDDGMYVLVVYSIKHAKGN